MKTKFAKPFVLLLQIFGTFRTLENGFHQEKTSENHKCHLVARPLVPLDLLPVCACVLDCNAALPRESLGADGAMERRFPRVRAPVRGDVSRRANPLWTTTTTTRRASTIGPFVVNCLGQIEHGKRFPPLCSGSCLATSLFWLNRFGHTVPG